MLCLDGTLTDSPADPPIAGFGGRRSRPRTGAATNRGDTGADLPHHRLGVWQVDRLVEMRPAWRHGRGHHTTGRAATAPSCVSAWSGMIG